MYHARGGEKWLKFCGTTWTIRDHLSDLGADEKIILKGIFKSWKCEHGNKGSSCRQCEVFLGQLGNCHIVKRESFLCRKFAWGCFDTCFTLNAKAEGSVFLRRTREVARLDICHETGYTDWSFTWFSSVAPGKHRTDGPTLQPVTTPTLYSLPYLIHY
jgi:hypothetical protein